MNTKTMVEKFEAKGYTMADLQGNWREEEAGGMDYPAWVKMMKATVEKIPVKNW